MSANRKPTARMIDALRDGAAHERGVISRKFGVRTLRGLVARGLAEQDTRTAINGAGRAFLAALDVKPAITRDDVAEGVREALYWMTPVARRRAEGQPASVALGAEFKRTGRLMRSLMKEGGRIPVEMQVLNYYNRVTELLIAARRFEIEDTNGLATAQIAA